VRGIARALLLLFAFTIPWEYSLDLGEPLGNVARVMGLLLLLVAVPAVLQTGRLRTPGALQWMVLALYLWFCCSFFWTVDAVATLEKMRAYFQEMMVVWLVWEFAETPGDLRALLRVTVAGSWVLAALTVADFASPAAAAAGQFRFVATGQDPNDVARFLDLGFPMAALLYDGEKRWPGKLLAAGYLPLGLVAVLLTASRGGFVAASAAVLGCGILLARGNARRVVAGVFALPAIALGIWFAAPHETLERLTTTFEQIRSADLNQRWNIWDAGWQAFAQAPILGRGAGAFTVAAATAPIDTAHNTALSILVESGVCGLFLAVAIVVLAAWAVMRNQGPLRVALVTALAVWVITSLVATVEESRTTWLLFALIALAGRLALEDPGALADHFPDAAHSPQPLAASVPVL